MSTFPRRAGLSSTRDVGHPVSFSAPVGGWNARDPLIDMPKKDAIYLENFFSRGSSTEIRKGCAHIANLPADTAGDPHIIRTLLNYSAADGSEQLFAACEDGLYDVTSALIVPAVPYEATVPAYVPETSTNAVWDFINTTTAGGAFLLAINGTDSPIQYDGSAFSNPTYTGVSNPKKLTSIMSYKSRLYFTYEDSLSFYYSGVNSISGALSEFPLAVLCSKGGYLVGIMNWTYSTSLSVTERIAMVTSEGQVVVYEGYDPSNSAYWALVGVFNLPRPIGRRCLVKMGGDVGILTETGLVMMAGALRSISPGLSTAITDKIRPAYKQMLDLYSANPGWELTNHESEGALLINVPQGTSSGRSPLSCQLVLNTVSAGWSMFSGWNPTTIASFGGKLFFASANKVYRGWYGQSDAGAVINCRAKTAFMSLQSRGRNKQISLVKPNFTVSSLVSFKLGIDTDFSADNFATSDSAFSSGTPAYWDNAYWDTATWDIESVQAKWRTVASRPGGYISFRLALQVKDISLTWNAVDCIVTIGGLL
jgi:hypothetical protein